MDWIAQLPFVGAGIIRSLIGWLENKSRGDKEPFDWHRTLESVLRVGLLSVMLAFGGSLDPTQASGLGTALDMVLSKIFKK